MRRRQLAIAQGVYFAATGVWPLIDMHSFERATGPRIPPIYLADAAVEAAFVSSWAAVA